MPVARGELLRLTAAKAVGNTALRWIPFFLFVLEDAFDATTTQLTLVLGIGEMVGLGTLLIGGQLDRGGERRFLVAALILISGSGIVALGGSLLTFAIAFVLIIAGVSLVTVSGHTWLSHRVPFERRGRAIGVFEMSWASALLIGAPIVALAIELVGWRGPFVLVAIAGAVMAVVIAGLPDDGRLPSVPVSGPPGTESGRRMPARAWVSVTMSAAIAAAGLTTIVIVGTWLEDDFGVSTADIGFTAMAFGVAEIIASGSSARFSDQLGKERTTAAALVVLIIGLVVMVAAGDAFALAVAGLAMFFLGFEYSIVTSFSIVSESAPAARGRALAANNAVGTLARGGGTVAAGFLYDEVSITGPAVVSGVAAFAALGLLTWSRQMR